MKNKVKLIVMCIFIIFVLSACGEDDNKIHVAYFDNITHGQALIMKSEGILQEKLGDEMEVDWVSFNAGPAEVEALFSGDIDIGYIGPVPAVTAYVQSRGDFVIISGATNGGAVLLAGENTGIKNVKDLDGKKVAVPSLGNTQHILLLDLLDQNGLKTVSDGGTVDVIASSNADVANLMMKGEVDAALVPEPWGSKITQDSDAEIILEYDEIEDNGDYSTAVVIVNKEYMEEHEDIVAKFLEAHIDATEYIVKEPDQAGKIMNKQLKDDTGKQLDDNIIKSSLERIKFTYDIPKDSIYKYAKTGVKLEVVKEEPKEDIFNEELLEKAK